VDYRQANSQIWYKKHNVTKSSDKKVQNLSK